MQQCINNEDFKNTGFYYAWSLVKGKYKVPILYALMEYKVVRYNAIKKYLGGDMSYKMLTSALRELEADGLVNRKEYQQMPPKVEYSLSDRGKSLIPILDSLCDWGDSLIKNLKSI